LYFTQISLTLNIKDELIIVWDKTASALRILLERVFKFKLLRSTVKFSHHSSGLGVEVEELGMSCTTGE
jgi:hypothetical protein